MRRGAVMQGRDNICRQRLPSRSEPGNLQSRNVRGPALRLESGRVNTRWSHDSRSSSSKPGSIDGPQKLRPYRDA